MRDASSTAGRRAAPPLWFLLVLPLFAFAGVFTAFQPALGARFLEWDDVQGVATNQELRLEGSPGVAWRFTTSFMGHYQPLSWWSLALDLADVPPGAELGDADAARAHRTNLLLHAVGAVAFGLLAERVLRLAFAGSRGVISANAIAIAALLAMLVWAVHPLRAESVAWITERRDVLSAIPLVLSIYLYVLWSEDRGEPAWTARQAVAAAGSAAAAVGLALASLDLSNPSALALRGPGAIGLVLAALALAFAIWSVRGRGDRSVLLFGSVLCLALSLLAKAWGMVVPAVMIVLDFYPLRRTERSWRALSALALEKAPFWALSVVFAVLAAWAQSSQPDAMPSLANHTLFERTLQACYGLAFYTWKSIAPNGLMPLYELPKELSLSDARFLVPLIVVPVAIVLLVLSRRRAPGALAAAAVAAIFVSPVLGFAQAGPQLAADRYTYLFGLPFALLAAGALLEWSRAADWMRWIAGALGAALIAALVLATRAQTAVWRDTETLWSHVLLREPGHVVGNLSLGNARAKRASLAETREESVRLLHQAEAIYTVGLSASDDPRFAAKLAFVYSALAELEPARREQYARQAAELSEHAAQLAIATGRASPQARLAHAVNLLAIGRAADALPELEWYVGQRPDDTSGWTALAEARAAQKDASGAAEALERAAKLAPIDGEVWWKLAQSRRALGDRPRALEAAQRVLLLAPDHAGAKALVAELEGSR